MGFGIRSLVGAGIALALGVTPLFVACNGATRQADDGAPDGSASDGEDASVDASVDAAAPGRCTVRGVPDLTFGDAGVATVARAPGNPEYYCNNSPIFSHLEIGPDDAIHYAAWNDTTGGPGPACSYRPE